MSTTNEDTQAASATLSKADGRNPIASVASLSPGEMPKLDLDESPFSHGLPMSIGFKMLATCISFMLFALLSVLVFALTSTRESLTALSSEELLATATSAGCAFVVLAVLGVLVSLYIIVYYFSKKHGESRFCKAFRRRGLLVLLIGFILIALCVAVVVMCHTEYRKIALTGIIVSALISFLPVTITWHVQEEERLKNFIDGFSKTCSCLAFMGGAIALLIKTFITG